MAKQPQSFDPRQQMGRADFELQYKRDSYLKDVALHHHDFYEIYFLLSGDVTYLIEGKLVQVMPGDLLLISPRELHQVCIRPEMSVYERFVLWVEPQTITRLSTDLTDLHRGLDPNRPGYGNQYRPSPEDRTQLEKLMYQLSQESHSEDYGSDLLCASLLTQLLVTINRLVSRQGCHVEEDSRGSRAVQQTMNYINLHYAEELSLDTLARQAFVSKYHLSHEFHRQVGTSVYQYIQKKRLLIARQLLSQGKPASQVYSHCGFNDYAGFYRAFKGEYGLSPRAFGQQAKESAPGEESGNREGSI